MSLNIKAFALATGICWGLACLFLGWTAAFHWGDYFVEVLSSFYIGYNPGFFGGIVGGIWGFVDGAIGGFIVAYIYNHFSKAGSRRKK